MNTSTINKDSFTLWNILTGYIWPPTKNTVPPKHTGSEQSTETRWAAVMAQGVGAGGGILPSTATLSGIQHVRYSWRALTVSGALLQNIESLPTIIAERSIQVPWYSDTTPLNGRRNQQPTPKATINSRQKYIISSMPLIRINNHFTKNVF